MMTVQRLIEELQRLPESVLHQDVAIRAGSWPKEVVRVVWEGNHVVIEAGGTRG